MTEDFRLPAEAADTARPPAAARAAPTVRSASGATSSDGSGTRRRAIIAAACYLGTLKACTPGHDNARANSPDFPSRLAPRPAADAAPSDLAATIPATVGQIRNATGVVVCVVDEYGYSKDMQSYHGLRSIQSKVTKLSYIPPSEAAGGKLDGKPVYDHSTAGLDAGGDKVARLVKKRYEQYGSKITIVNIEQYNSINVPTPLSDGTVYDPAIHKYLASTDRISSPIGLRKEVARMRLATVSRAKAVLASQGLGFIEVTDYDLPGALNIGDRLVTISDSRVRASPAIFSTYTDLIDAAGPHAQFIVRQKDRDRIVDGTGFGLTAEEVVDWRINGVKTVIESYALAGLPFRPMATIWPVVFVAGASDQSTHAIIPAGMMTRLLNGLHAAGCRMFWCWYSGPKFTQWSDTSWRNAFHARYEEVAAWVNARSDIQKVV